MALANVGKISGLRTTAPKAPKASKKVAGLSIAYMSATGTAVASWSVGNWKSHLKNYMVRWEYTVQTTSGTRTVYASDSYSAVTATTSTFNVPQGALTVSCSVYPVSTDHKVGYQVKVKKKYTSGKNKGKYYYQWSKKTATVAYWTGSAVSASATTGAAQAPSAPGAPVLSRGTGSGVTVGVSSNAHPALRVQLNLYTDGAWASHSGGRQIAIADSGEKTLPNAFAAAPGHSYRVDARQQNIYTGTWSDYSAWSETWEAPPTAPADLEVRSVTATSFLATWRKTNYSGDGFELRWGPDPDDLLLDDLPGGAYSASTGGAVSHSAQVAPGTWYFAVRGTADVDGEWSQVVKFTSGLVPAAPTIGKMLPYAALGSEVELGWTYNNADGSTQSAYQAEARVGDGDWALFASGPTSASGAAFSTLGLSGGEDVQFRVRVQGAVDGWSPYGYSPAVTIDPPLTVTIAVGDPTALPLSMAFSADADVRLWHLLVTAAEASAVTGEDGNAESVPAGAVAFEGIVSLGDEGFDPRRVEVSLDPANSQMADGVRYVATLDAISAHGLTDSDSKEFATDWDVTLPAPVAVIPPVDDDYAAHIFPACYSDAQATDPETGEPLVDEEGEPVYELQPDVTLAVYRIDSDGTPLLVAGGIANDGTAEVIDPHPSFGGCWYRIAATSATGAMGFADVDCESERDLVVIQFADGVRSYADEFDAMGLIELPYDLEVTEKYSGDASLVEFIGNPDPTLYTGTQRRRTVSARGTLLKSDDPDVVRKVRWLEGAMTRAYYRDPTGLGFWAWVTVTLSRKGPEPVSAIFDVTRVMGDYGGAVEGAV